MSMLRADITRVSLIKKEFLLECLMQVLLLEEANVLIVSLS